MADIKNPEDKPMFRLRLLVDKEKNKVVLAEAGKDFVDILFSFLTMPMGSIVRLLEHYQQNKISQAPAIGCFNNLYKSVLDMSTDNFLTEACKHMLLYPRSVWDRRFNWLSLGDAEPLKYYRCPKSGYNSSCSREYSNFCSSRCSCGALMDKEFKIIQSGNYRHDETLVSGKTLLIITDDLKLVTSMGQTLKTLRDLGYTDVDELEEKLVDANFNEVFALLECLFSSDTPLTDVFLRELGSLDLDKLQDLLGAYIEEFSFIMECMFPGLRTFLKDVSLTERNSKIINMPSVLSVNVFTRKKDKEVLYVECGEDFVNLLFTFLAIPLKSVWEISGSNANKRCIGNLCDSYNSLSFNKETTASTSKCMLPWYYSWQRQLLDVCYEVCVTAYVFTKDSVSYVLKPRDPRCDGSSDSTTTHCVGGFVKRETMFMVSDDLIITPMNSSKAICLLKKMNTDLDDIEEQVINITKAEATSLLRASLMTSTAMTTALGSLLVSNKPKGENSKAPMSLLGRMIFSWCNFRFL